MDIFHFKEWLYINGFDAYISICIYTYTHILIYEYTRILVYVYTHIFLKKTAKKAIASTFYRLYNSR